MARPVYIIGVLDNGAAGLSANALQYIRQAEVVIAGRRVLALFEQEFSGDVKKYDIAEGLAKVPLWIEQACSKGLRVVVLATGDPMCHGIGSYLLGKLADDICCEVIPNVSVLQLAFARAGIAWQKAVICSLHSKDAGEWGDDADYRHGLYPLLTALRNSDLVALFTSPENSPDRIARMLIACGMNDSVSMTVAEALLMEKENIIRDLSLHEAAKRRFADPNVVILQRCKAGSEVLFGLNDDSFAQRKPHKGLITKREVRAVSLARLQLCSDSIVWDIGAGSGAVGLEAARLCRRGYVYAIEKNADDSDIARSNARRMAISNYRIQHGKAPKLLAEWPDPDAIFIGGSGGELAELIELCLARIKVGGWLVMNFVTLENMAVATKVLKKLAVEWDVTQIQASRSQPILHMHRMHAENPVWIVCATRGDVS